MTGQRGQEAVSGDAKMAALFSRLCYVASMQTPARYDLRNTMPQRGRTALAAAFGLFAAGFLAPQAAAGSSVSSGATVTIVQPAGVIGVQELSNGQGFLAPPATVGEGQAAPADAPLVRNTPIAPPPSGGALAASVAISGAPNQAFSLTITDSLVVVTETGELVVTNFDHNAGTSPMIGSDGAAQIAIGATAQNASPDALQNLATNAGGPPAGDGAGADPNIITVTVQTEDGPQAIQIQRPDNFGPTIFGEKFFTVLVSYN
jgi:hypothetical protein